MAKKVQPSRKKYWLALGLALGIGMEAGNLYLVTALHSRYNTQILEDKLHVAEKTVNEYRVANDAAQRQITMMLQAQNKPVKAHTAPVKKRR